MSASRIATELAQAFSESYTVADNAATPTIKLNKTTATLPTTTIGALTVTGATVQTGALTVSSALTVGGQTTPASVTISPAAGTANVCLVTFTVKDGAGTTFARPVMLDVFLSDAATGAGLTTSTASGAVAAGASGKDIATLTTKKALRVQTDVTGVYILSITDTVKTGFYPCAQLPTGIVNVGSQLVTGNYG